MGSLSHHHSGKHNRHHQDHTKLPNEQWQSDPAVVGSSNHQREIKLSRPWNQQAGESAFVESTPQDTT